MKPGVTHISPTSYRPGPAVWRPVSVSGGGVVVAGSVLVRLLRRMTQVDGKPGRYWLIVTSTAFETLSVWWLLDRNVGGYRERARL